MNALRALCFLPLLLALAPAQDALAGPPCAARAAEDDDFMEKFRQAMKVGATDEMNRLVRQHQAQAVFKIVELCEFVAGGSNDKLESEIAALRKAWKAVYNSNFADNVYEYYSLLSPEYKSARQKIKSRMTVAEKQFFTAEKAKDHGQLATLGQTMKELGDAFREIGDHYFASHTYLFWASANDDMLRGEQADLKAAHDAYQAALAEREAIDLKDNVYGQAKERHLVLEKMGFGAADKAAPKPGEVGPGAEPAGAPAEAAAAVVLTPAFELVPDIETYRRPIYNNDGIYPVWAALSLRDSGSKTTFTSMKDGPNVLRVGPADVAVDANRDGVGEAPIPLTGNVMPVETTVGQGEQTRPWGFLTAVGGDRDTYNGIQYNLAPSKEYMSLYVAPAASMVTELNGVALRILDDNLDGVYGSLPIEWGHTGLLKEQMQRDVDSIVVGEASVAIPWSELVEVGGTWYRLQPENGGTTFQAKPLADVQTGTLKLDLKGVPADYVIVRGAAKTANENAFFLVTKQGVRVPAGAYQLFQGQVAEGKKMQRAKALMLPSGSTPTWTVAPGETVTMQLGAPFGFVFETVEDDTSVTVVGTSVAIVGRGGETYQRMWNCVPRPEASYREEGKKRGSKGEDMRGAETQEELAENWVYGWFPKDLKLEKKDPGPVEVQLVEKKNRLFGAIESEWR